MTAPDFREHDELHRVLADLIARHGPQDPDALARRARRQLRGARVTPERVELTTELVAALVLRPDGRVDHLSRVLDGIVMTHRVRGPLHERTDLWLGRDVQPFLTLAACGPLRLTAGGEARISRSGAPALLGPAGWLPDAGTGDLIGLWWRHGALRVTRVDPDELAGPREELHVRTLLAERLARGRRFSDADPDDLAALVVRAVAQARLEDPGLLATPHAPLGELLHDPVVALHAELVRRAPQYGMTFDQFLIAVLGHLAWRTPFAEDPAPWDRWLPEAGSPPKLTVLPGGSAGAPGPSGPSGPPEAA